MFLYFKKSTGMPFRGSPLDLESNEAIARRMRVLRRALRDTQEGMAKRLGSDSRGQLWGNYENFNVFPDLKDGDFPSGSQTFLADT